MPPRAVETSSIHSSSTLEKTSIVRPASCKLQSSAFLRHLKAGPDLAGPKRGLSMAYVLYRDHTIVSSGLYDDVSGQWKLTACISWKAAGIDYSMKWIDRKLSSSVLP